MIITSLIFIHIDFYEINIPIVNFNIVFIFIFARVWNKYHVNIIIKKIRYKKYQQLQI